MICTQIVVCNCSIKNDERMLLTFNAPLGDGGQWIANTRA